MPAGDNPHSISEKKAALRESPKQPNNVVRVRLVGLLALAFGPKSQKPNQRGCFSRRLFQKQLLFCSTFLKAGLTLLLAFCFRNWWNKKLFHSCFKRDKDGRYILYLFNQTTFSFSTAHSPQQFSHSSQPTATFSHSHSSTKHTLNEQPTTSPFPKDKVAATVGIKRPQPYGPLSPTNHHTLSNPGANGHLVYVRRRVETDQSKGGTSARRESASCLQSQKLILKHQNDTSHTQCAPRSASPAAAAATPSPALQSAVLSLHHSFGKQSPGKVAAQPANDVTTSLSPSNVVSSTAVLQSSVAANLAPSGVSAANTASCAAISATNLASCSAPGTNAASSDAISATSLAPNQAPPSRSSNQDQSERFLRLQAFLRHNEQSDQEEYLHKLRSLSPVGRSRHAFELEKRAANLLIEEGKELQKIKVLNVLGKLVTPSLPNQPPSVMHLLFTAHR